MGVLFDGVALCFVLDESSQTMVSPGANLNVGAALPLKVAFQCCYVNVVRPYPERWRVPAFVVRP